MNALHLSRRMSKNALLTGALLILAACGEDKSQIQLDAIVNSGASKPQPASQDSTQVRPQEPSFSLNAADKAQLELLGEQFVGELPFPGAGKCEIRVLSRCAAYPSALGATITLPSTATGCQKMAEYLSGKCKLVNSVGGSFTKNANAPEELRDLLVDQSKEKEPIKPSDGCPETAVEDIFKAVDSVGEPVEVVFWDTFCGPCRAKLPTLDPSKVMIVMLGAKGDAESFLKEPQFRGKKFQCMTEVGNEATKYFKISGIPFSKVIQPRVDDSAPDAAKVGVCKVAINQCTRFSAAVGKSLERRTTANMCSRLAAYVAAACGSPGGAIGTHAQAVYDVD